MASEVKEESNSTPSDVKNEVVDEEMKDDSKIKDGEKDSLKNESKNDSDKDGSDEDEEEDEDEEVQGLLDRPVVMTGCRARKQVERLEMTFSTPKEKQEFLEGKGKKLGDCPRIEAQVQKIKVVDLKPLHKILFNRIGSANEIKKNIRKFSGFPFEKSSSEYARKKASLDKMTASVLKQVCLILDIERGGTKEDIVNRIMEFLLTPEDSGKKVPKTKKKASKEKKKSTSKKGKSEKKGKVEKSDDSGEEEPEESEADDDSTGEASTGGTDEEAEGELKPGSDSDDDDDDEEVVVEPKKKSKEIKSTKAKSKVEKGKKEDKKTKGTKRKQDDDSDGSSSDDKPPAKKSKMPSDEEISKLVKQILDSADLQEITMKKVIKQVSDAYPDFDLSHKKAFIKSTIKSVIS